MIDSGTEPPIAPELEEKRARLYRVRGIVLRRRDLGEADRIVTLFTAEHGKRRVVAKGTRRTNSRLAGHLEPFMAVNILVARTKGLDIVSQAEAMNTFPALRSREADIAAAGYFAELIDTFLPDEQANDSVFELLYAALDLLEHARDARLVTQVFEMGLLRAVGYRPQLEPCIACGEPLEPVRNGFSIEGGVICHRCLVSRPDAVALSVNALKLLREIDRGQIDRLFRIRVPDAVHAEVATALSLYIAKVAGRESQAQRVLRELRLS